MIHFTSIPKHTMGTTRVSFVNMQHCNLIRLVQVYGLTMVWHYANQHKVHLRLLHPCLSCLWHLVFSTNFFLRLTTTKWLALMSTWANPGYANHSLSLKWNVSKVVGRCLIIVWKEKEIVKGKNAHKDRRKPSRFIHVAPNHYLPLCLKQTIFTNECKCHR